MGLNGHFAEQQIGCSGVRFGSKADITGPSAHVRFTPASDRLLRCRKMSLSAINDQSALQQKAQSTVQAERAAGINSFHQCYRRSAAAIHTAAAKTAAIATRPNMMTAPPIR
jgi:hypothetical protein